MFYSQFILAKKGPLGTIWIAAHLERKLRKNQVADTDIGVSVDSILFPEVPIALRLSSHLLLGVVRIYSRKVNYLFDDCSEALLKVKQAFRSTAVDLPPEESTAPYHSITLPETFDLDDFELPDSEIFQGNYVDHHVSTREQITLQDTMEGVVYSTTQFGLDERFGDGDTSGLDLDEELFLNKVTAPGHTGIMLASDAMPHASVQPMTPLQQDKNHEGMNGNSEVMVAPGRVNQLEGLAGDTDFVEYAQAPCTPGLVEEPNLSKTQEASVCDDHMELGEEPNLSNIQEASACDDRLELEDHTTKFAAKENLAHITSNSDLHCQNANAVSWSLQNDRNPVSVLGGQEINHPKSRGDSQSIAGNSLSAEPVKPISPAFEFPDRNFTAVFGIKGLQNLQNGAIGNNEPSTHSIDGAHADNIAPQGVRLDETISCHSFSHEAFVLEDPFGNSFTGIENISEKSCLSGTCQPVSECILEVNQALLMPHVSNNVENTGNMGKSCPPSNSVASNVESPGRPHAPGASIEVQGEGCHATDFMELVLVENHTTELASFEGTQVDFSKLYDHLDNVISEDTGLGNIDGSENSELPAPEKLLSVSEGLADRQDNSLMEYTPDIARLVAGDGGYAGINIISEKKRSFTESTLTVQSLNSVESMGVVQSKRTKESVPDDNDLLSSILVGRRSSVLKMKPTPPPPPAITCMKRPRSTSRVCASKRKVLMDDTMVLHGDVIRQQLTSTEDIRRIRKKAPCTRPEIWMIQKEFLEDEIFSEPIFTGLSTGLTLLHSQTYDLTDLEFVMEPNINKESGILGINESIVVRNNVEVEPCENQQGEDHVLRSQGYDTQVQMEAITDVPEPRSLPHEHCREIAERDFDKASDLVADAVNPTLGLGVGSASSTDPDLGDKNNMPAGSMVMPAFLDKESGGDGSLQIDASDVSPDQKLPQSVEMGPSVVSNGKGVNSIRVAEENDDTAAVGETELRGRDAFLLEETEGRALMEFGADVQIARDAHTADANPSLAMSPGTDRSSDQVVVTIDQAMEEISKNEQGVVNDDEVLAAELDYDGKNSTYYGSSEEPKVASSCTVELDVDVRNASLNEGVYPGCQEADPHCTMDAEITSIDHIATEDHGDFDYTIDGHDTGFLNADDDDVAGEDEDCMPSTEQTSFLENSGWSSRTRAVAKYLQSLFDKEAEHGRKILPMDNLLVGKTRKEASRMFFEALVLKTRDYIHVEQGASFDNINIKPRVKLMKSDF